MAAFIFLEFDCPHFIFSNSCNLQVIFFTFFLILSCALSCCLFLHWTFINCKKKYQYAALVKLCYLKMAQNKIFVFFFLFVHLYILKRSFLGLSYSHCTSLLPGKKKRNPLTPQNLKQNIELCLQCYF